MSEKKKNYQLLKDLANKEGISLFGVADIKKIKSNPPFCCSKRDLETLKKYDDLCYGISLSYVLSTPIINSITNEPTRQYLYHYRQVNLKLDQTALRLTSFIQELGYEALPIPASVIIDWQELEAELSHRLIAYYAGLGYIGNSGLIVNPKYGSRIRLVSILTNLPCEIDQPLDEAQNPCNSCNDACIKSCPAGALSKAGFRKDLCLEKLREFAKKHSLGTQYICGICIKVCNPLKKN
jgi:epoxyqueuosine reductase QueG